MRYRLFQQYQDSNWQALDNEEFDSLDRAIARANVLNKDPICYGSVAVWDSQSGGFYNRYGDKPTIPVDLDADIAARKQDNCEGIVRGVCTSNPSLRSAALVFDWTEADKDMPLASWGNAAGPMWESDNPLDYYGAIRSTMALLQAQLNRLHEVAGESIQKELAQLQKMERTLDELQRATAGRTATPTTQGKAGYTLGETGRWSSANPNRSNTPKSQGA